MHRESIAKERSSGSTVIAQLTLRHKAAISKMADEVSTAKAMTASARSNISQLKAAHASEVAAHHEEKRELKRKGAKDILEKNKKMQAVASDCTKKLVEMNELACKMAQDWKVSQKAVKVANRKVDDVAELAANQQSKLWSQLREFVSYRILLQRKQRRGRTLRQR